jgi:NTE family protein
MGDATFYDTKIPLKVIAYDLIRREELVIEDGSLVDAVRQSIAIPGVINPVLKKDRLIIDGGVVNPLPTNVIANMGIKKIIAVNVLQSPGDIVKGYEIIERQMREEEKIPFGKSPVRYTGVRIRRLLTKLFYPNIPDIIVRSLQAVECVIAEYSAKQADVLIHPDLTGINWFELYQVDRLIKSGEEATHQHLAAIKKLVNQ